MTLQNFHTNRHMQRMHECLSSLANNLFINQPIHLFFQIFIPSTWFIISSFNSFFCTNFLSLFPLVPLNILISLLLFLSFLYTVLLFTLSASSVYNERISFSPCFSSFTRPSQHTHTHTQISRVRLIMQIFVLTRSSPL